MSDFKLISIVTPVYNMVDFIEQTIKSVICQNYPNLEYIIIDGGSTDGTCEIIEKYKSHIKYVISEPDEGMYDALNKGFRLASGEIMGWINSDDILIPGSLMSLNKVFSEVPKANWVQGLHSFIDLEGNIIRTKSGQNFSKLKFLLGDSKWIQQESTFWRRNLWEQAGSHINTQLKLAGDFELWFRFSQQTKLFNLEIPIGAWRKRDGQLSGTMMDKYIDEVINVLDKYDLDLYEKKIISQVRKLIFLNLLVVKLKIPNPVIFDNIINRKLELNNLIISYSYIDKKFK